MMSGIEDELVAQAWAALSADHTGTHPDPPAQVEVVGAAGRLPSHFFVEELAQATVAAALLAAAALSESRGAPVSHRARGSRPRGRCGAERTVLPRRRATRRRELRAAARGSGRRPTAGCGRTRTTRGTAPRSSTHSVPLAMKPRLPPPSPVSRRPTWKQRVFDAGGIAAAVRTLDEWQAHPQGQALAREPLIAHRMIGDAAPNARARADQPAAGVRVLDFTRVIAGPVCTRFLGALGADVLRLDPPGHPDLPAGMVADSLLGKRSSFLDLDRAECVATLHDLLARADVVVCGYRPGALDRFGLDEQSLTERYPGIVVVYLDAWGHSGPWAGRRGFDSVVQAPTGIAMGESAAGGEPGALPCQLLDHGTGYLAAAAVSDGLRRQAAQRRHARAAPVVRAHRDVVDRPRPPSAPRGGARRNRGGSRVARRARAARTARSSRCRRPAPLGRPSAAMALRTHRLRRRRGGLAGRVGAGVASRVQSSESAPVDLRDVVLVVVEVDRQPQVAVAGGAHDAAAFQLREEWRGLGRHRAAPTRWCCDWPRAGRPGSSRPRESEVRRSSASSRLRS